MREVIQTFISSLNDYDVESLKDVFSDDVTFRDLDGWQCAGKKTLLKTLDEFLGIIRDYRVMVLDIEEMMGSFKLYIQTFGILSADFVKSLALKGQMPPTDENLHPPSVWKIGFHSGRINLWNMDSIAGSIKPKDVAISYVWAINTGKSKNVVSLMTEQHTQSVFGNVERGDHDYWSDAWNGYYKLFPDYKIYPESVHNRGEEIIIIGSSDGTMSEHAKATLKHDDGTPMTKEELQGPAIWSAITNNGFIERWSIYPYNQETIDMLDLTDYGYKPPQ